MSKKTNPLAVEIAGIKMKTPITTGSGTFGYGTEYADYVDVNNVGAIIIKGTSVKPKAGNTGCRVAETPSGIINAIGLENPGIDKVLSELLPKLKKYDVPVIANVFGDSIAAFEEIAERASVPGIAALELNISCPNTKNEGMLFGCSCATAAGVVSAVRKRTKLPIITKLTPNVTNIAEIAKSVEDAGSDAVSLINTVLAMAINVKTRKPYLGNVMGGLSGPAVKPIAVRMVYQVAKAVKIPIIGQGGIMTGEDAIEFMLAGASAVSIGTANFINPRATETIAGEMLAYLKEHKIDRITDLIGGVIV